MTGLIGCVLRTGGLVLHRRIRQPTSTVGRLVHFADGSSATVYRETVIDRPAAAQPAVLAVCFRLRGVRSELGHALFRVESELNSVLFAGFPGLVSKLWFRHDENGLYRGIYQWDDPALARAYTRTLSRTLALVSEPGSIRCRILPGRWRDQFLAGPDAEAVAAASAGEGWWLPSVAHPSSPGRQ